MCLHAVRQVRAACARPRAAPRLELPYLVGLAAGAGAGGGRWRALRRATLAAGVSGGAAGYAAVGLPSGSCLVAEARKAYAARELLGSALARRERLEVLRVRRPLGTFYEPPTTLPGLF